MFKKVKEISNFWKVFYKLNIITTQKQEGQGAQMQKQTDELLTGKQLDGLHIPPDQQVST